MEKIWLKNYQEGIPEFINPQAYTSLVDFFEQSCAQYKDHKALHNLGTELTYADLEEKSRQLAAYFQVQLGLKKGDRVAIMMPNLLQYPIAIFAALRAGLVVVNVNPLYTPDELTHQINDSGAQTIIVLANFAFTVAKALPRTKLKNVIVTQLGDLFPFPKRTIVNFVVKYVKKMVPSYSLPEAISFTTAMNEGASLSLKKIAINLGDTAFLQYTGGTTGVAKGAVLSHGNLVANIEQAHAWVAHYLTPGQEVVITALPLYHIFSLTANALVFMKAGALNVLITNPRDIPDFVKQLSTIKFTAITGVNTLYNALLNNRNFAKIDFSLVKVALGGGMAVQKFVADKWKEVTGAPLLEAYGLTETSPAVTIDPMNVTGFNGSIGLPLPSTEISIRDNDGNELGIDEVGELCIRGPQVMQGYWQKPQETAKVMTEDGFLKTGDVARVDEEGFVFIVDRKKDMIVVSGFNVYPNEVEHVMSSHPGILEVGVVGIPVDGHGEKVKAFIVRQDPDLTEASIREYCKEHLTAYKIPKLIEFRDELPKTPVGKILRRALRDESA